METRSEQNRDGKGMLDDLNKALNQKLAIVVAVLVLCILALAYCCFMNMKKGEEVEEKLVSRRVAPRFDTTSGRNANYWATMYNGGVWRQDPNNAQYTKEGMMVPSYAATTEPGSVSVSGITSSGSKVRFAAPRSDTGSDWSNWSPAGEGNQRLASSQFDFEKGLALTGGATSNYNPYFESALSAAMHGN